MPTPYPRSTKANEIEFAIVLETLDPPLEPPWDTAPLTNLAAPQAQRAQIV